MGSLREVQEAFRKPSLLPRPASTGPRETLALGVPVRTERYTRRPRGDRRNSPVATCYLPPPVPLSMVASSGFEPVVELGGLNVRGSCLKHLSWLLEAQCGHVRTKAVGS